MTKQEYEAKLIQIRELRIELDKNRCINCEELWEGICRQHGAIPEEFAYMENTCDRHQHKIPF